MLVPLLFAVLGGALGERFHRAVDRVGLEPDPEEPEPDLGREAEEDTRGDEEDRTAEQDRETEPVAWA